jgi:uncharacterized protein YgiM (DUF1202 family)
MTIYNLIFKANISPFRFFTVRNSINRFFILIVYISCLVILNLSAQHLSAQSNRWLFVGTDSRGAEVFLDKTSVDKAVDGVFAWDKIIYSDGSYAINRSGWDCQYKQHLIVTSNVYTPQGDFIKTVPGRNVWLYITPDSVAESLFNTVCRLYSPDSSSDRETVRVASKMANVRESPATDAAVVGKAAKGKVFELVNPEPENGWYQIHFKKNQTAWIHRNTIE